VPLSQFVQPFVNRKRAASETSERACCFPFLKLTCKSGNAVSAAGTAQQNLAFFAPRTRTVFTKLEYLILNHPG
jgi:hypothetical protein